MYKAGLALLVGLMLTVSGTAWATTFKDGVISSDNVVEKPAVDSTSKGKTGLRSRRGGTNNDKGAATPA